MCRHFGNAFNWYSVLVDEADKHIDQVISIVRQKHLNLGAPDPINSTPPTLTTELSSISQLDSRPMSPSKRRRESSPSVSEVDEDTGSPRLLKRSKGVTNPFPDPLPRDRPSDYLRERCPLYFGGQFSQKQHAG